MSRSRSTPNETRLTASQIEFAQSMLPFRYREVVDLSSGAKSLLFAAQEGRSAYSELHMAAGERAILRLSQEIAQLDNALILVDEVEAGLHPWVQRLLMLQLQQLSLRNNLQIIVTSHSPVVLDSVPSNGRIFLDRDQYGKVNVLPAYRDLIQNALYGRSDDALNLLCEDDTAEGILRGVFDFLAPRQNFRPESLRIGRDTGADEFPSHANAFRKFGQIDNFIFVLDGDRRNDDVLSKIRNASETDVSIFFLPGSDAPEMWIWERISESGERYFAELGLSPEDLMTMIEQTNAIFDSASDSLSNIAKSKLNDLSDNINRSSFEICRIVARLESDCKDSDIQPLVESLENALINWRSD